MRDKFITAYLLRVDEESGKPYKGYLAQVENSLDAEQRYVNYGRDGGLIQVVSFGDIDVICNDEGKLLGMPNNRAWIEDGNVLDVFVGNIMCVRHNSEGEFTSILESDIDVIEKTLYPILAVKKNVVLLTPAYNLHEYKEKE